MVAGPDGRKMSKSYGNVVKPEEPLEKFGADALRAWAATGTLGDDYPYTMKELEYNFRFLRKLWNACRFTYPNLIDLNYKQIKTEELQLSAVDTWILNKFNDVIESARNALELYNFRDALTNFTQFFWHDFCDDYLEAVKYRIYNKVSDEDLKTAQFILYFIILNSLKVFAPFAPFITEEIYGLIFAQQEKISSIHLTSWPEIFKNLDENLIPQGELAIQIIKQLRDTKSKRKIPLSKPIAYVYIKGSKDLLDTLISQTNVISNTLKIEKLELVSETPDIPLDENFEFENPKIIVGWKIEEK